MTETLVDTLHAFLRKLTEDEERSSMHASTLLTLPPDGWDAVAASHPEWIGADLIRRLLIEAEERVGSEPGKALTIAAFAARHATDAAPCTSRLTPVMPLRAQAALIYGRAALAHGNPTEALNAAITAEATLKTANASLLDLADAKLLRARSWGALERDSEALDAIDDCLQVFAAWRATDRYVDALGARAILLAEMGKWTDTWETLDLAADVVAHCSKGSLTDRVRATLAECVRRGLPERTRPVH